MHLERIEEDNRSEEAGTKRDRPVARSVLSLPVQLYLHGVTCPINREALFSSRWSSDTVAPVASAISIRAGIVLRTSVVPRQPNSI